MEVEEVLMLMSPCTWLGKGNEGIHYKEANEGGREGGDDRELTLIKHYFLGSGKGTAFSKWNKFLLFQIMSKVSPSYVKEEEDGIPKKL
jgi:hypothetical protein